MNNAEAHASQRVPQSANLSGATIPGSLPDAHAQAVGAVHRIDVRHIESSPASLLDDDALSSRLPSTVQRCIEKERAAIARELHDDVGGTLAAIKMDLAWITRNTQEPSVIQRAESAMEAVDQAMDASKRIMHDLRPAILDQGIAAALQWLTTRFEKRTGIECLFHSSPEAIALDCEIAVTSFRFAQEALTNVSKHAGATRVRMDLSLSGQVLSLEVSDNGRGFEDADLHKAGSFGLAGLRERAETMHGWVDIASSKQGSTLLLSIPVPEHRSSAVGAHEDGGHQDWHRIT